MAEFQQDAQAFNNISASTSAFALTGGCYRVSVKASNYGTVKLQQQAGDGSTYLDLKEGFDKPDGTGGTEEDLVISTFAADGSKVFYLSPGQYRLTVASCTAIYVRIVRVPLG